MVNFIKKNIFLAIRKYPLIFDVLKRASRLIGNKSEEYDLLCEYGSFRATSIILQIGANDGISNDPVREFFIKNRSWRGFLIEPIPHLFKKLKANYRGYKNISFYQCAVSDQTGNAVIYSFKKSELFKLPFYADQIASFDKYHLLRHFPKLTNADLLIEELIVPAYTINDFIRKNRISVLDVLIIDVEGYEKKLLEDFPFHLLQPDIIIFETLHMFEAERLTIFDLLKGNGYSLQTNVFDTIAIKNSLPVPKWIAKYKPV